ncbi:hypothetical protein ABIB06_001523 [Bradyrhizobium sp. LB8.2]
MTPDGVTPDGVAIAVMIILLFPMGYFTLASPAFLLVKLDIQPVAQLLRGMFNAHFLVMRVAGIIGTVAFLSTVVCSPRPALAWLQPWRSTDAAASCGGSTTSSARETPAIPKPHADYAGYIGAGCWATRCCSPLSWPVFPTSPYRRERHRGRVTVICSRRPPSLAFA